MDSELSNITLNDIVQVMVLATTSKQTNEQTNERNEQVNEQMSNSHKHFSTHLNWARSANGNMETRDEPKIKMGKSFPFSSFILHSSARTHAHAYTHSSIH